MMSSRYTVKLLPRYVFLSEINIWFGWENKADSSLCCRQGFYSQKKAGIEPKREDNMPSWVGRICPAWQPLSRGTSFSPAFKVELKYIDFCGSCKYWCLDWNIDSWALTVTKLCLSWGCYVADSLFRFWDLCTKKFWNFFFGYVNVVVSAFLETSD